MRQNKLKITIKRKLRDVFRFTTDPANTHVWIPTIVEEIAGNYPPEVGTVYKNRGAETDWDEYSVSALEPDHIFELTSSDGKYHVRYTYNQIKPGTTEMEYFEWMDEGELANPYSQSVLENLKSILENK